MSDKRQLRLTGPSSVIAVPDSIRRAPDWLAVWRDGQREEADVSGYSNSSYSIGGAANEQEQRRSLPVGVIRVVAGDDPHRPFSDGNTRVYVLVDGEAVCELPATGIGLQGKPGQAGVVRLEFLASHCEVDGVG